MVVRASSDESETKHILVFRKMGDRRRSNRLILSTDDHRVEPVQRLEESDVNSECPLGWRLRRRRLESTDSADVSREGYVDAAGDRHFARVEADAGKDRRRLCGRNVGDQVSLFRLIRDGDRLVRGLGLAAPRPLPSAASCRPGTVPGILVNHRRFGVCVRDHLANLDIIHRHAISRPGPDLSASRVGRPCESNRIIPMPLLPSSERADREWDCDRRKLRHSSFLRRALARGRRSASFTA